MALQTTYTNTHAVAYEGMEADLESAGTRNVSRTCEVSIGFGKAVSQGAGDHGIVPFATAPAKFLGVTVRDQAVDADSVDAYRVYDTAGVKEVGRIWVKTGEAVVAGDPVYLTSAGAFVKTVGTNTAVPNARFDTTAASGDLAIVRLK